MIDNTENYLDGDVLTLVSRFERMVKDEQLYYFDVHEFESIIDHYIEENNLSEAVKVSTIASRQHPTALSLQIKKAQILIDRGQHLEALSILKKIQSIESTNKDIFLLKANIYNLLGKYKRAKNQFDKALEVCFEDREDLLFRIALSFEQLEKFDIAIEYLQEALLLDHEDSEVLFELGYCYEKIGNDEKSIETYKQFLDLNPFSDNAWYNIGIVYNRQNDFEKAIEAYDFALVVNEQHSKAYFNKANALANSGLFEEAIKCYTEYLDFDDDHASTLSYIGECFEKLNEYDQALNYYENAIKTDENFPDAWFGMGLILMYQEKIDESLVYLEKAKTLDNTNPDYWFALGSAYTRTQSPQKAVQAFREAIDLDPNDTTYAITLAEYYHQNEKLETAIDVLFESEMWNPECPQLLSNLVAYHILIGDSFATEFYANKVEAIDHKSLEDLILQFPELEGNPEYNKICKSNPTK